MMCPEIQTDSTITFGLHSVLRMIPDHKYSTQAVRARTHTHPCTNIIESNSRNVQTALFPPLFEDN